MTWLVFTGTGEETVAVSKIKFKVGIQRFPSQMLE